MSDDKKQEEKFDSLLKQLNKSTETLAGTIAKTPFGDPSISQRIEFVDDEEYEPEVQEILDKEALRESNRGSVFEITNNRGRVIVLDLERARTRVKNKLSMWKSKRTGANIIVDGLSISTRDKSRRKIEKLMEKAEDGDLNFPIKFKVGTGVVDIDYDKLEAIHDAIEEYIQSCIDEEEMIYDMIDHASSTEELANILVENNIKL